MPANRVHAISTCKRNIIISSGTCVLYVPAWVISVVTVLVVKDKITLNMYRNVIIIFSVLLLLPLAAC